MLKGKNRRLLTGVFAFAALSGNVATAQPGPARLTYAAYFISVEVAEVQASLGLTPEAYQVQLSFHLVGAPAALFHAQGSSKADGLFQGDRAVPRELLSTGQSGGKARVTQIEYQGNRPVVTHLEPPLERERDAVPPAEQVDTIDLLSAIATLLRRVRNAGRCDSDLRTFDGRWISEITAKTIGEEAVEKSGRSSFNGMALRCDIEGRQVAGFWHDTDEASLRRPHKATVWFARITTDGPLVPVRIRIATPGFGSATLYITGEN